MQAVALWPQVPQGFWQLGLTLRAWQPGVARRTACGYHTAPALTGPAGGQDVLGCLWLPHCTCPHWALLMCPCPQVVRLRKALDLKRRASMEQSTYTQPTPSF